MKNKTRQIVALLVTAAMLTGCGAVQNQDVVSEQTKTQEETQTESVEEIQSKADTATEYSVIGQRPRLISTTADSSENISPAADSYTLEKDLSNVDNLWQFYLDDKMTELLAKNGFVVSACILPSITSGFLANLCWKEALISCRNSFLSITLDTATAAASIGEFG